MPVVGRLYVHPVLEQTQLHAQVGLLDLLPGQKGIGQVGDGEATGQRVAQDILLSANVALVLVVSDAVVASLSNTEFEPKIADGTDAEPRLLRHPPGQRQGGKDRRLQSGAEATTRVAAHVRREVVLLRVVVL